VKAPLVAVWVSGLVTRSVVVPAATGVTDTVSWVALLNVTVPVVAVAAVVLATVAPDTNPVPVMTTFVAPPPTVALVGLMPVMVGAGAVVTVKVPLVAVPPSGLVTRKVVVPAATGVTGTVRLVALTNVVVPAVAVAVVVLATVAPDTKFVPVMVTVVTPPPTVALDGLMLETVGATVTVILPLASPGWA
jgi:hypothetical protein